ncbi:MAG: hypothetical protein J6O62_01380 [Bacilli bacterium]|nr:hypothetical protein [Bacilli bacterium]
MNNEKETIFSESQPVNQQQQAINNMNNGAPVPPIQPQPPLPPMPPKKSKGPLIIIVLLLLIIFGLAGYICYDKFMTKDEPKTTKNTTKKEAKEVLKIQGYLDEDIIKKEGIYDIQLPKLKGDTDGIKKINKRITRIYNMLNFEKNAETVESYYEIRKSNYKGINILDVVVYTKIGPKEFDGDELRYCYHYNIDTGKEYTLNDIVKKENYSTDDMTSKLNSYLNDIANNWGGEKNIKGKNHIFVSENDMYDIISSNDNENSIIIVLDGNDGYVIENESKYSAQFEYSTIDYKIIDSISTYKQK